MITLKNSAKELLYFFTENKVVTINEIKVFLNTNSRTTIHRKLCRLDYNTSYSHAGRFYTLHSLSNYNHLGVWDFNGIYFSKYGTLSNTIIYLISHSKNGYFAFELKDLLKVFVHNELLKLYQNNKLKREQIGNEFLYISTIHGDVQLKNRKELIQTTVKEDLKQYGYEPTHVECLKLFLSVLNEKQRRLFLGFESLQIGYGGDTIISEISGVNVRTISKGRKELLSHDILIDRIRTNGGGRPSVKKN